MIDTHISLHSTVCLLLSDKIKKSSGVLIVAWIYKLYKKHFPVAALCYVLCSFRVSGMGGGLSLRSLWRSYSACRLDSWGHQDVRNTSASLSCQTTEALTDLKGFVTGSFWRFMFMFQMRIWNDPRWPLTYLEAPQSPVLHISGFRSEVQSWNQFTPY